MKYCPNCGTAAEDNAAFCTQCGNHFAPAPQQPVAPAPQEQPAAPQQPVYTQEQPVAPQQPVYTQEQPVAPQQPVYAPAPQQPMYAPAPQKKNRGVFIALIIVIVLLLAVGGFFAYQYFFSDSDKDDSKSDHKTNLSTMAPWDDVDTGVNSDDRVERTLPPETTPPATNPPETTPPATNPPATNPPVVLGYTKGGISGDFYVNEWLNLTLPVHGTWGGFQWSQGSATEYSSYENSTTDCGLILSESSVGYQIAIAFEELSGSSLSISESDYLDIVLEQLVTAYEQMDITSSVSSYQSFELCGASYLCGLLTATNMEMAQAFFVRKLDDHMVFIAMTLPNADVAGDILEAFAPAY